MPENSGKAITDLITVTVEPSGLQFQGHEGQSLMAAANVAGIFWPTVCGGEGRCLVCMISVAPEHQHRLSHITDIELDALSKLGYTPGERRLACQAKLQCDSVTVVQRRVRPARPGDRLPLEAVAD